ncbi:MULTISPECIES: RES domain-containing protein [Rhodococcus]|uniref:RES domain-containing protein n=1 Tax=Rhodococcus TaxID=1827 RepID=UPI001E5A6850|nr:RES domain-containing protein [Rhodococcus opacus]MDJ0420776.1 RES domain-containing protein [Rhodococcus opacus]UNN05104.1 RES family NAD+ phosphorylase [Rhodococcus opacus]
MITLLETWCGIQLIPSPEIAQRVISAVVVNRELHLADATSNAAIGFGMTSEISTTTDYALTQQWPQALHAAGFDGIRYWARDEMTHVHACVALFAPSGDQTSTVAVPSGFTVVGTDTFAGSHRPLGFAVRDGRDRSPGHPRQHLKPGRPETSLSVSGWASRGGIEGATPGRAR